jgi:hypothetical protein
MGLAVEEEEIGHGGAYPWTAGDVAPEEVAWTAWHGVKVPSEAAETWRRPFARRMEAKEALGM